VRTTYVSSNTDAATYYAATDGVTADCTAIQNINTPASSILAAIECANDSTGNIVEIRQGTYDETLDDTNSPSDWPRGTSWSNPAIIRAFPGEIVTLRPTSGSEHINFTSNHRGAYYLSFENLRFDYSDITWFHSQVWGNMGEVSVEAMVTLLAVTLPMSSSREILSYLPRLCIYPANFMTGGLMGIRF
jgi:hypothetical protein